jgi:hypothetical protein
LVACVVQQADSYRRASGERRQQLKWLASGIAVCGVCGLASIALSNRSGIWQVFTDVAVVGIVALPASMAVAILRYRLYEIDRIISRTLAYTIVTGLLVGLYAGLVLLATHVLSFSSPVAVAASTLAAAALFSPLRQRVQQMVDRRFQPGPLRRRPDRGRIRRPSERRRGPGLGPQRPGRSRPPDPGTSPPVGVDQPAQLRTSPAG